MFGEHDEKKLLHRILGILERAFAITDFVLFQRKGDFVTMITGINLGSATPSVFQIQFVPPNGVPLPTSPTVSVDDPFITLGPVSVDGNFTFTATGPSTDTSTSCNISVSGTNAVGVAISHTFNVPLIAAPPPQITDFGLTQLS